jgi:hypothetical protein
MHASHEAESPSSNLHSFTVCCSFSHPLSLFSLHTLHFASLPSEAHVFRSYTLPRVRLRLRLRLPLGMMAGTLVAVIICVVINLGSAITQVFRFHRGREIWKWSHWNTSTWWSFIQVLCYIIGFIVTIALWQKVPSASNIALQSLMGVCWLNSLSGQVCRQVLQEG